MAQKSTNLDIFIGQSLGLAISLPSALLYFAECLAILLHWKQFNSSFYKLFLFSAFNNLFMNFLPSFLYARLIRLGWINEFFLQGPFWLPNVLCFIMYYNYHCENIAAIFTLLHRLSVILNPLNYEKIWRSHFLPLSILCIFLGPLLFTYRILMWPLVQMENSDKSIEIGVNSTALLDKPIITNFSMMLLTSIGYLLVNFLLNFVIYFMYKKKQAKFSLKANDKSSRLLVYAIAIFLAQLLLCLFWLLLTMQQFFQIFPLQFNLYLSNQYVWMNDVRTVAFPAWFLLWASTELNESIRKWFPWLPSFQSVPQSTSEAPLKNIKRLSVAPAFSMSSSNSAPMAQGNHIGRKMEGNDRSKSPTQNFMGLAQVEMVEQQQNGRAQS